MACYFLDQTDSKMYQTRANTTKCIKYCEESRLRLLARATPHMGIGKRKLLLNVFFKAQLNYCPLIWVLDGRYNNNNNIQYTKYACDLSTMRNALHAINV